MKYPSFIALSALILSSVTLSASAAPLADPCGQCHKDAKVLGAQHPPVDGVKLSDCLACHQAVKKPLASNLHIKHDGKASCESCHDLVGDKLTVKPNAKTLGSVGESDWELYQELFDSMADQKNAARLHGEKGLGCRDCHDTSTPQEMSTVKNAKCESCHGTVEAIAAKTVPAIKEQNPHKSHQGSLNCSKCHSGHGTAKSYCIECHSNFKQTMPEAK